MNIAFKCLKAANPCKGLAAFAFLLMALGLFACSEGKNFHELQIKTKDGRQVGYQVEIALTPEERAYGLMDRKEMPSHHGMIFLEEGMKPRLISMWMKNTYIPLDMLFVNSQGVIAHIHEGAVPHDLSSISSIEPAIAVIELNAGQVKEQGITAGDSLVDYKKFWEVKKALE
jgi:hypothetical protein